MTVHVFAFGAIVVEHASPGDDFIQHVATACGCDVLERTRDVHRVALDADLLEPAVNDAGLSLPRGHDALFDTFVAVFAHSVGLERYERRATPWLRKGRALASGLARTGRADAMKSTVRGLGALAQQRLELARWFLPSVRPDDAWTDPKVDRLYDVLLDHFDLPERHDALREQLASIELSFGLLVQVWEGRRARALEIAILALIAVEFVVALTRDA
ncbi:MAG: RMD1 family protein [Myxococcota bacterium]